MIVRLGDWRRGPRRNADRASALRRRFTRAAARRRSARAALRLVAPYVAVGIFVATGVFFGEGFTRRADGSAAPEAVRGGTRIDSIIAGRAAVIDGDTIAIRGRRIRLDGIDAVEADQTCEGARGRYDCGREAARALAEIIGAGAVECRIKGRDVWGRSVAVCLVGGHDIGGSMVRSGWAIAAYGDDYAGLEREARAARRGIWQGAFESPAKWRREQTK